MMATPPFPQPQIPGQLDVFEVLDLVAAEKGEQLQQTQERSMLPEGLTAECKHRSGHRHPKREVDDALRKCKSQFDRQSRLILMCDHTQVRLRDETGGIVATAYAFCRGDETFNKHLGWTIALGRALKWYRRSHEQSTGAGGSH